MEIKLTRFNGGHKGPLVMFHGLGITSIMFSLDTIDMNAVEYFANNEYDVWLVDWRSSASLPAASRIQYNIDDSAAYDIPAAVVKILEITGHVCIYLCLYL